MVLPAGIEKQKRLRRERFTVNSMVEEHTVDRMSKRLTEIVESSGKYRLNDIPQHEITVFSVGKISI